MKIDAGTRFATMILDHFIMTFVMMIFWAPAMIYDLIQSASNPNASSGLFVGNLYVGIFAFSLYFNKDVLAGRSPGKRILKLQVVDIKTDLPATPLKCLVRNITIMMWPVEACFALANPERRLGDFIACTKLVRYDAQRSASPLNLTQIGLAIILASAVFYLIMFVPLQLLESATQRGA